MLEVLLGEKTTSDARAAWKKYEKEKSERNTAGDSWLLEQFFRRVPFSFSTFDGGSATEIQNIRAKHVTG